MEIHVAPVAKTTTQNAGGVMEIENNSFADQQAFSTGDILWAVGVWSVILSLSPVVMFYVLRVH